MPSGKTDVRFIGNSFSSAAASQLTFTLSDGLTIRDNQGIQKIQIQNADNGTISNNVFECRFGSNCLSFTTAGGGPFDYTDPADAPNDFDVTTNTFNNYNVNTNGYFISFFAGLNINFIGNRVQSAVVIDDNFVTMLTIENVEVYLARNVFVFPSKDQGDTNGTLGINIRVNEGDVNVVAEHNTLIMGGAQTSLNGNACLGVYDNGAYPGLQNINIDFNHNICYNPFSSSGGNGVSLNFNVASSTANLTDSYNGFSGLNQLVNDYNKLVTSLDATSLIGNPAFKLADADPLNDYELSPFSDYLDINGTEDVGAFSGVRGSLFHINAAGTVDYVTVDATTTGLLSQNLRSNDTLLFADGAYGPFVASGTMRFTSGLNMTGSGAGTVFSVPLGQVGSAITLQGIDGSSLNNLVAENGSSTQGISTYTITRSILEYSGNTYNESAALVGANDRILLVQGPLCDVDIIDSDGKDVSVAVGNAVDNWNVGLVDLFGDKIMIYAPNNFVTSSSALVSYVAVCGAPITVDLFIDDVFTVSGGNFTYNASVVASAVANIRPGDTNPARIDRAVTGVRHAGIELIDSNTNSFSNVISTNSSNGILFLGTSAGNTVLDSTLSGNIDSDVRSESSGDNTIANSLFTRTSSVITGAGRVNVRFSVRALVQDTGLLPVGGAQVTFTSANSASSTSLTTDGTGYTAYATTLPAYQMTNSSISVTSGGFNPYSVSVSATGTLATASVVGNIDTRNQLFTLTMPLYTTSPGGGSSAPGNGGSILIPQSPFISGDRTAELSLFEELGFTLHDLVKLPDDGNPNTQLDSTVYYLGADGKRHAFPNASVYRSWYCDFSLVRTILKEQLAMLPLGKNVTYKPGIRLVKFPSIPTVYLVQMQGTLRAIANESMAMKIAGAEWNKNVSDISEEFYFDYTVGAPLASAELDALSRLDVSSKFISGELGVPGYPSEQEFSRMMCNVSVVGSIWPFTFISRDYQFVDLLSVGSTKVTDVRALQEFLAWKGPTIYQDGRITGNFGSLTEVAVKRYQLSKGIQQTGEVGPLTRAAMSAELESLRYNG